MTTLDEFKAMKKQYEQKIAEEGQAALGEELQKLFASHQDIKAIAWTQYTPYFNDGEPCEFSVNDFTFTTQEVNAKDVGSIWDDPWQGTYGKEADSAKEAVRNFRRGIPEDLMKAAFGDHAQVVATRDGFHVTEYSHD